MALSGRSRESGRMPPSPPARAIRTPVAKRAACPDCKLLDGSFNPFRHIEPKELRAHIPERERALELFAILELTARSEGTEAGIGHPDVYRRRGPRRLPLPGEIER